MFTSLNSELNSTYSERIEVLRYDCVFHVNKNRNGKLKRDKS